MSPKYVILAISNGIPIGAVNKLTKIAPGIFLIKLNSNPPNGIYQPLFTHLHAATLAAISIPPKLLNKI